MNPEFTWGYAWEVALSLGAATGVGAIVALHPLKIRRMLRQDRDWDLVRAQVLITVAAALMVVIIGESTARAFGLVGLGSFIRFRTVLKNPRDTATLFLLIALGMTCGVRMYPVTAVGAGFVFLLLFLVESGPLPPAGKPPEPPLPDEGLL